MRATAGISRKESLFWLKEYKKNHKARKILVNALEFKEFNKITDKSTLKSTFDALCATYDEN